MTAPERTAYAPVLLPASGLRWARRRHRDHAPAAAPSRLHIALGDRLLCDDSPRAVTRGVREPVLLSEIHPECLRVYRFRHDPERFKG